MSNSNTPPSQNTPFAPSGRVDSADIRRQAEMIASAPFLTSALESVNEIVVIVNRQRQIVFANRRFPGRTDDEIHQPYHGIRPGEAVGCVHALSENTPDGCGTTEFCSTCGAVRAVLESQKTGSGFQECNILTGDGGDALNLKVRASQIELGEQSFTVVSMDDIGAEIRRDELERVFFHDILNTAGAVKGLAEMLELVPVEKHRDCAKHIVDGARHLVEEIASHRIIMAAENGELVAEPKLIDAVDLLRQTTSLMAHHQCVQNRQLIVEPEPENASFQTDPGLLSRVLVNMIKNALEATPRGGIVKVSCRKTDSAVFFDVHNETFVPREVAMQIFQRSYSTKGPGRGHGTFAMRLITERYLGGKVSFSTSEADGTTFTAECPRRTAPGADS